MIHFSRIMAILDEIRGLEYELDCESAGSELIEQEIKNLRDERSRLEAENEEYMEGYRAGVDFHLGSGYRDDDDHSPLWHSGFNQAGQDS